MTQTHGPRDAVLPEVVEIVFVALALGLLVAAQLLISNSLYLFSRNLWLDEIYTHTVVSDPDAVHAFRAGAAGFDIHPPGLHLLLRAFTLVTGDSGEVSLRGFSLLSVFVALLGLYITARRVYSPQTAFAATLMVWVHPLVLFHAFEARSYGPWLAAIIWFSYFLERSRTSPARGLTNVSLALSAVLVCTVHYFGVITLALVVGAEILARHSMGTSRWPGLWSASLGPVALVACVPLIVSQRSAYTVPTWQSAPTLGRFANFCSTILLPKYLGAVVITAWLSWLLQRLRGADCPPADSPRDPAGLAGLTGLLLFPITLVLFSYTVQPALVDRYGLPTVAALGPCTAFVASRMSRIWVATLCVFLVVAGTRDLGYRSAGYQERDRWTAGLISAIRRHTNGEPILFESPHELYVVCRYAPDLAGRCFALDFEQGQIGHADDFRMFVRDAVRSYATCYPVPALMTWDAVRDSPKLHLVPHLATHPHLSGFPNDGERYPGFTARQVEGSLYQLVASGIRDPGAVQRGRRPPRSSAACQMARGDTPCHRMAHEKLGG